jgi:hypothetical protein
MFTYAPKTSLSAWMAAASGPIPIGGDYLPRPPGAGPGPVVSDKDHPYIDIRVARRTGEQPNNRVADLSNSILQPWVRESPRKLNARALSEPVFLTPKETC